MMAKSSEEDGHHSGLGWVPGRVTKLVPESSKTKIPHVGFNDVACKPEAQLFQTLPDNRDFYFLHSYRMEIEDQYVSATCDYSGRFVAAIEHGNIMGTQFHPEKAKRLAYSFFKISLTERRIVLKQRMILCLLMNNDGVFFNSRCFKLQPVGELDWINRYLDFEAIDELVLLNISREDKSVVRFSEHMLQLSKLCFVPISAGGA